MPGPGKPYNDFTPLGQLMREHGINVKILAKYTRIHTRVISHYLSADRMISPNDLQKFVMFFELDSGLELLNYTVVVKEFQPSNARLFFETTKDDLPPDVRELIYGEKS